MMARKTDNDAAQLDEGARVSRATAPVTLRLGDLEDEVHRRVGDTGSSPATIIKRDLDRYYSLLGECRRHFWFTLPEAEAIVLAIRPSLRTPARYIWAEVERQYLEWEPEGFSGLPDDLDAAELVEKLRKLKLAEAYALLDAVETFYAEYDPDPFDAIDPESLINLGLASEFLVNRDVDRRAKEKASGATIARDPAANLRRNSHRTPSEEA